MDARADAVEFDVRITADGQAVVIHDAAVDRTTDGAGLVRDLTLAEMLRLRIDGWGDRSLSVPTLHEALASLSGRVAVDIEIKNVPGDPDFDPDDEVAVRLVHGALDDVAFAGDVLSPASTPDRSPRAWTSVRRSRPGCSPTWVWRRRRGSTSRRSRDSRGSFRSPIGSRRRGSTARAVHDAGLLLGTWIVDEPARARALLLAGVDAVATNQPRAIGAACRDLLAS